VLNIGEASEGASVLILMLQENHYVAVNHIFGQYFTFATHLSACILKPFVSGNVVSKPKTKNK